jgi:two-component system nitrate/nitrite response regulator NarL
VPIRLILADDHPIVLQGLQKLFGSHEEFDVISSCADGVRAIEAVRTHRPDVLVLDLKMPGKNGLDVLGALAAEGLDCRTVLLTAALDDNQAVDAVRLGAMGVVLKESSPEVLLECVRRVHRGERWLDHDTMSRAVGRVLLRESATREAARALTPREIEMVQLVAQGLRNKVIADRLSISEGTVKIHLHNIYEKLGVDGRLELVLYAQVKGLV